MLDYDEIKSLAEKNRPKMILAGASAYPRTIDFKALKSICDEVGAYLFVDIAHIAGLIVAGIHPSPVPYAEFVTTTTHKTMRGPRGGVIMCKKEFAKQIDSEIFPGIQGGPLMHVIAAKAVAFKEALEPSFKEYQTQIIKNAKTLSVIEKIDAAVQDMAGGTTSETAVGGMKSKIDAAKIAVRSGIPLVIAAGTDKKILGKMN